MRFADVIGQQSVKARLGEMIAGGRVPHSLMFYGNEGCGKFALALAMAQYLCCENPSDGDSCGHCLSCRQLATLQHPDVFFVYPIVRSDGGKETCDSYAKQWREMIAESPYFNLEDWNYHMQGGKKKAVIYSNESEAISEKLSFMSRESAYRCMIIWLPERMHESCANKLLKLVEEPPANTLFFFVSDNPDAVLPTIVSRTQLVHVPPIDEASLTAAFGAETARVAAGNYVQARKIAESAEENAEATEKFRELMLNVFSRNLVKLRAFAEDMDSKGREAEGQFLSYAQRLLRESFVANLSDERLSYMSRAEKQFVSKFRAFIGPRNVERIYEIFSEAADDIERNVSGKIVFFDMAMQLMTQIARSASRS